MEEPLLCKQTHAMNKPFHCEAKKEHSCSLPEAVRVQQPCKYQSKKAQSSSTHYRQPAARSGDETVLSDHTPHLNTSHSQFRHMNGFPTVVTMSKTASNFAPCLTRRQQCQRRSWHKWDNWEFLLHVISYKLQFYDLECLKLALARQSKPFKPNIISLVWIHHVMLLKTMHNLRCGGNVHYFHKKYISEFLCDMCRAVASGGEMWRLF